MSAIQVPDGVETINGLLCEYHFGDYRLFQGLGGQESSIMFFDGPNGRVLEPQIDDNEPFTRRVRVSQRIMHLAISRPDILQNEDILWGIAVSLGLKL